MRKLKRFLLLCFCFVMLSSSVVYGDETIEPSFNLVVSTNDYKWYAQEGAFTVASCRHDADNTYYSWSFHAFSKNDSSKRCKQETSSGEAYGNISRSLVAHGATLVDTYGWTEEEANYVVQNFTYLSSFNLGYYTEDGSSISEHNEHVLLDYVQTSNPTMVQILNDLKPYFFDEDAWDKDGNFIKKPVDDSDKLPLPTFKIEQAWTVAGIGGTVKYTFNWKAGEHEIYAKNPNKYNLQMLATAKYREETTLGTTTVVADSLNYIYPECNFYISNAIPIYKESYSFLERETRNKLCDIAGVNKNNSSEASSYFYLFVRVVEPETGKTSLWKVYKCQGRNISSTGFSYDDDGKSYPSDSDDEIDSSANFDSDPSTDAEDDTNSPFYNDGAELDARHLINNLEEIVETLKGVPELFEKVFLWMPDYLIVLIATSIGLIIVIGFVKTFLR